MIRVLIAEDSATARALLVSLIASDPELELVGEATDGVAAVEMTRRLAPDVVTMDVQMPRLDGFEATRRIMTESPTPIVIVSGSVDVQDVAVSMNAFKAGALSLLPKPGGPRSPNFEELRRTFISTIKAMAEVKVVRRYSRSIAPRRAGRPAQADPARSVVAIAASTGGPAVLHSLLAAVRGELDVPVLVVQHIARGFGCGFAAWLDSASPTPVRVAADGDSPVPGSIYVAPDDRHLRVASDGRLQLWDGPKVDGFRPSASVLFESIAAVHGKGALALVLSGMGRDGVDGLRHVHSAGGRIIVQDEPSSVVFGMPGAAVAEGLADAVLPPAAIAAELRRLTSRGAAAEGGSA